MMSRKLYKGAYLCSDYEASQFMFGSYAAKIQSQIAFFNEALGPCRMVTYGKPKTLIKKVIRWVPFLPTLEKWPEPKDMSELDFIYIRKPVITRSFISFLKRLRKNSEELKIILEVPTYPYDKEANSLVSYVTLKKDAFHRRKLHKYIDRIADLSGNETVFNVPTLQIINGINLERIKPRQPSYSDQNREFIIASGFEKWHGIDRIVGGLCAYLNSEDAQRNIKLHLVGDGPLKEETQRTVERNKLTNNVIFHGALPQHELLELYSSATLAFSNLGFHRTGVEKCSALKTREYLAVGIPFVFCGEIDVFGEGRLPAFAMEVSADDALLNFNEIIEFHDSLYGNTSEIEIIESMRKFASETVTMDKAMAEVEKYIKDKSE